MLSARDTTYHIHTALTLYADSVAPTYAADIMRRAAKTCAKNVPGAPFVDLMPRRAVAKRRYAHAILMFEMPAFHRKRCRAAAAAPPDAMPQPAAVVVFEIQLLLL